MRVSRELAACTRNIPVVGTVHVRGVRRNIRRVDRRREGGWIWGTGTRNGQWLSSHDKRWGGRVRRNVDITRRSPGGSSGHDPGRPLAFRVCWSVGGHRVPRRRPVAAEATRVISLTPRVFEVTDGTGLRVVLAFFSASCGYRFLGWEWTVVCLTYGSGGSRRLDASRRIVSWLYGVDGEHGVRRSGRQSLRCLILRSPGQSVLKRNTVNRIHVPCNTITYRSRARTPRMDPPLQNRMHPRPILPNSASNHGLQATNEDFSRGQRQTKVRKRT